MNANKILIVDDSSEFRTKVRNALAPVFEVEEMKSAEEFRWVYRAHLYDLVILDMRLDSGREGLTLLREILALDDLQPVIMVSAYGDTDAVLDAAEGGALMFLHKQEFTPDLLARMVEAVLQQARIRRHLAALQARLRTDDTLSLTAGKAAVKKASGLARRAAEEARSIVLLSGEYGAGHLNVASGIHEKSNRAGSPFVSGTMESQSATAQIAQLIGTSDSSSERGLLREANNGTLFLQGLSNLTLDAKKVLLEATTNGRIDRDAATTLDCRLILGGDADDCRDIRAFIEEQKPALRIVEIVLPPLRSRKEDVPLLATYFLQQMLGNGTTSAQSVSTGAIKVMQEWSWPGNLLELETMLNAAAIRAELDDQDEIGVEHLPLELRMKNEENSNAGIDDIADRAEAWAVMDAVSKAIAEHHPATKTELARILKCSRYALDRKAKKVKEYCSETIRNHGEWGRLFGVER